MLNEKETCCHNWVHYARKQCKWDEWGFGDSINGIKPENYIKDSNNMVYMYICTMCGEEFWSQKKEFDIPYYRVKEVKSNVKQRRNRKS